MAFLIIIFVLLAIVGSWLWLKPSEQEKRSAILRQYAIGEGLKVRFTSPGSRDTKLVYSKLFVDELNARENSRFTGKLIRANEGVSWAVASTLPALNEFIESFMESHDDVVEIELTDEQISFTWREKGGEQVINDFLLVYEKIMTALH